MVENWRRSTSRAVKMVDTRRKWPRFNGIIRLKRPTEKSHLR